MTNTKQGVSFSTALILLKQGKKVKRKDWGGYWFIAHNPRAGEELDKESTLHHEFSLNKLIVAKLKDGGYAPAQPYQGDLLADDWEEVE